MRFDDEDRHDGADAGGENVNRDIESDGVKSESQAESEELERATVDASEDTGIPEHDEGELKLAPLEDEPQPAVQEPERPAAPMVEPPDPRVFAPVKRLKLSRKQWAIAITALVVVAVVVVGAVFVVPVLKQENWTGSRALAIYIALGVLAASAGACLLLRKTLRTRVVVWRELRDDPDINDWLVIFDWTPKVLYVPTFAAAFIAAALMYLEQGQVWCFARLDTSAVGGIWFGLFFLNFLIEEYNVSIKLLLITTIGLACFLLWLNLLGAVGWFFHLFTSLAISMSGTGFLLIGMFGLLTIAVSWVKGLFYYVTLTPNYMNIQEGPTETGEQIGREDYNSRVDTGDFVERMMGFGRIVITFKDQKRQPITLLVWQVGKKAKYLERVRGKIAIDQMLQK